MKNKVVVTCLLLGVYVVPYAQKNNVWITKGDSCMEANLRTQALEYYKIGVVKNPSPENQYKLSLTYNAEIKQEYIVSKNILKNLTTITIPDSMLLAKIYLELGNRYRTNYQYDSAEIYLKQSVLIGKQKGYYEPLQKMTRLYINKGDFIKASSWALETLKAAQKTNDIDLLARSYLDLGVIQKAIKKEDPKALAYLQTALQYGQKSKNYFTISSIYEALSSYYSKLGYKKNDEHLLKKAMNYMEKAYDASSKVNDYIGMAHHTMTLASFHADFGEFTKAEKKFKEAEVILLSINSPSNTAEYYYYYGDFLFISKINPKEGLSNLKKAAEIWGKAGLKFYQSLAIKSLALAYEQLGEYENALIYSKRYHELNDEVTGEETQKQLQDLNIKYETEKKDAQLSLQKVQLLEKQQRIIQIALASLLLILVLIILFALYRRYQLRKLAVMESSFDQTTQQLQSFNYSVSHDLRHPLINAQTALGTLAKKITADTEQLKLVEKVQTAIASMNEIIDTMLMLASIERDSLQLKEVNTKQLVEDIVEELETTATIKIGELPTIKADVRLLRQVLINLLSNAVKYTSQTSQPIIEVTANSVSSNKVQISVHDNGIGFDDRFSTKLFQLFGRLHADFQGIGVGLVIVKKIIEKHNGRVWASGKLNEGAIFSFELPI